MKYLENKNKYNNYTSTSRLLKIHSKLFIKLHITTYPGDLNKDCSECRFAYVNENFIITSYVTTFSYAFEMIISRKTETNDT